jgi:hypothetical protein
LTREVYIRAVDASERGIRLIVALVATLTVLLLAWPIHS